MNLHWSSVFECKKIFYDSCYFPRQSQKYAMCVVQFRKARLLSCQNKEAKKTKGTLKYQKQTD